MSALSDEIAVDPADLGYAGKTAAQVVALLDRATRPRVKASMTGDEIFAATDGPEFAAASEAKRNLWMLLCARAAVDPSGAANVALVTYIFGVGSTTLGNLAAARTELVSRAVEIGLPGRWRRDVGDVVGAG